MNFKTLKLLRASARVQRLHTLPTIYRQSVGEHTYNVLWLAWMMAYPRTLSTSLMLRIMRHDVPEAITGDIPGPTLKDPALKNVIQEHDESIIKRFNLPNPEITPWEEQLLQFCDKMEFAIFALEEVETGNRHLLARVRGALKSVEASGLHECTPAAQQLVTMMKSRVDEFEHDYGEDALHGWPA